VAAGRAGARASASTNASASADQAEAVPAVACPAGTVPPGKLVVLGDNVARRFDSRQIGYVPADRLLGVVLRPLARREETRRAAPTAFRATTWFPSNRI
jgi:type IV secretory pathway protease TraF